MSQDKPFEFPWSTFGGLRSYSSRKISSYFVAINGTDPFRKGARPDTSGKLWEGFSEAEREYITSCGHILKGRTNGNTDFFHSLANLVSRIDAEAR
jgi:hypothetical protein